MPDAVADRGAADVRLGPTTPISRGGFCDDCRLLEEANHRIANHLSMLAAFARLKAIEVARPSSSELTGESVQLLLESIRVQIEAVARLHRSLAGNGRRASADLGEHLHEVCAPLESLLTGGIELIEDFAPGCLARPDQILPLTQIVSEAITNAVKHAYPSGQTGKILVRCRQPGPGALVIEIADDGPGLPVAVDTISGGGLGLRLMRALGKQLGARIAFKSEGAGLTVLVTLPSALDLA
ncbi:sensor histidine kinase [Phenylobacterium sp. LH3H17]|uniref:sensor histidine kinase n=1 Tax=Phenylobacterium sp. LH3H17 TaxID=2903901 RepID=UPI0020C9C521|nr:sensor histidine kinase [Phenylobacterium sp. LH3H17]UTP41075.1 sensor histidine kinase [Phenylobacterium sp. LH3H17]